MRVEHLFFCISEEIFDSTDFQMLRFSIINASVETGARLLRHVTCFPQPLDTGLQRTAEAASTVAENL